MSKQSVLVVEDEDEIRELVSYNLLKEGFQVAGVVTGEEALALAENRPPDLVILDLMLPGVDGLTVCRRLKENPDTESVPIIVLTAKGEGADVIAGLNQGADDYITKPFSPQVLIARARAVLRRSEARQSGNGDSEPTIEVTGLRIDPGRHQVHVEGRPVDLTATEFRVLTFLAHKPGWVFSRQQILDGVHGDKYAITDRAVDVQIVGLRRKLGEAARYIETVRGVGYRFRQSASTADSY